MTNSNRANYNAMILSLRGRAGARTSFQASYTLAHAKDYIEAGTHLDQDTDPATGVAYSVPDQNNYFGYYEDANYDVRQRFSFSGVYTIPGLNEGVGRIMTSGWELSLCTTWTALFPNKAGDLLG